MEFSSSDAPNRMMHAEADYTKNRIGAFHKRHNITPSPTANFVNSFGDGSGVRTHIITRVVFLERPTNIADFLPFAVVFFIYGLIVHSVFMLWKKFHKKSFNIFLLVLVFLFPPFLLFVTKDLVLLGLWAALACYMAFCLKIAFSRAVDQNAPKRIFKNSQWLFKISNSAIVIGHCATILSFLLLPRSLGYSLRMLFYSLYISVLSREFMLNLSHVMAASKGYFKKDGIPVVSESLSLCMVCAEPLGSSGTINTLICGHSYHSECIRGWCLIGQNNCCPYCKRGVDLNLFKDDLWNRAELSFRPLMNTLRSFISFFIIITCYIFYKIRG
ncbi:RING finger protein 121/175 [Enteropsectra breve]|nr:RING finger protein 121/175 [Enteropsectra breve]